MNIYTVHINKSDPSPLENAVLIKEGFSLWAAMFQGFWALYNKMWLCTAALIILNISFATLEKYAIIGTDLSTILQLAIFAIVGFEANDWYRKNLANNGFALFDIVSGNNLDEARKRFFEGQLQ